MIGDYALNVYARELRGLQVLSDEEISLIAGRFKGETAYRGPQPTFLGRDWALILGTLDGVVSRMAAFSGLTADEDSGELIRHVFEYCEASLGTPTSEINERCYFNWATLDGDVTLMFADYKRIGSEGVNPCVILVVASTYYRQQSQIEAAPAWNQVRHRLS